MMGAGTTIGWTLLLSVLFAPSTWGQDASEAAHHLTEGNRLYDEGDFSGAVDSYRMAEATGLASGPLYYNLGNAYFRLDEIGQAIRHYEKASHWLPDSPELAHNLTMAREQTVDRFSRVPEPFWRPAWNRLVRILTPAGLFFVGAVFYVTALAALALRVRRGRSPWLRRATVVGGLLAVCFISLGLTAAFERAHDVQAVVLQSQIALLDRPDGLPTEQLVHEGTVVDVVTRRAAWSEIRLPNGTRGWVPAEAYGTI